jgi:hypothetical protein
VIPIPKARKFPFKTKCLVTTTQARPTIAPFCPISPTQHGQKNRYVAPIFFLSPPLEIGNLSLSPLPFPSLPFLRRIPIAYPLLTPPLPLHRRATTSICWMKAVIALKLPSIRQTGNSEPRTATVPEPLPLRARKGS